MTEKISKTDDEWRTQLTPEQYQVCRQAGTERAFAGEYEGYKVDGVYECVCCGTPLFNSEAKFDSGSGWPSFCKPIDADAVEELEDTSHGMRRVEARCTRCESHLGHIFPDGPQPTGLRYCVNSLSLSHKARE
jgi:peptide-methionine (R)-S-oxide reductase